MPSRNPRHRFDAIRASSVPPEHSIELALWHALRGTGTDPAVVRALEIYEGVDERETMQAWFIAYATDAQIQQTLRVSEDVTHAYRLLFFDITVFRDELDVIRWVREYADAGTDYGAQLLQNAVLMGPDYLAWLYSRGVVTLDPEAVKKHVMADAFFRGRQNRHHAMTSKEAQVSHAFMTTAFRASESLGTSNIDMNQILIKLRYRDMTEPVDAVAQHEEILH